MSNTYQVKCVLIEKVSHYHIVNTQTGQTHSVCRTFSDASQRARDLNRMAKVMGQ